MRKLLLLLLILVAALYIGADLGIRAVAEQRVGSELESSLKLAARPSVSLGSFPFLPKFFSGSFPQVSITGARSAGRDGPPFSRADLTLHDVRFSASRLVFGDRTEIRAASGAGTILFTAGDLNRMLGDHGIPALLRVSDGRLAVVRDAGGPPLSATISIAEHSPAAMDVRFGRVTVALPLPTLGRGVRFTSLDVQGSRMRLRFAVEHGVIQLS